MLIRSMTGYGRGGGEASGWQLTAELRSVNHRGLDVRFAAPAVLGGVEPEVRRLVRGACHRGRVEVRVALEAPAPGAVSSATLEQAAGLYETLSAIRDHLQLAPPIGLRDLQAAGLELHPTGSHAPPELAEAALDAVREGLAGLVGTRETEGAGLRDDFLARLAHVRERVDEIETLAATASAKLKVTIAERVATELSELGLDGLDTEQLRLDLIQVLDKSDITEEVVRARAHTEQLTQLMTGDEAASKPQGKRIDFFLQELIRESNTMASKSMSAELSARVVDVKVEVERMREQVQNVE